MPLGTAENLWNPGGIAAQLQRSVRRESKNPRMETIVIELSELKRAVEFHRPRPGVTDEARHLWLGDSFEQACRHVDEACASGPELAAVGFFGGLALDPVDKPATFMLTFALAPWGLGAAYVAHDLPIRDAGGAAHIEQRSQGQRLADLGFSTATSMNLQPVGAGTATSPAGTA